MVFTLVGFTSCSPGEGFSSLEEVVDGVSENGTAADKEVEIQSYTPLTTPVVLTSSNERTFAVTVNSTAGSVNYVFKLDGVTIQNSTSPFYIMNGNTLSAGAHTLVVEATNSLNTDTHTFNLRKNTAPSISLNTATSSTIACTGDSYTLSVSAFDLDSDLLTFSFLLNGAVNNTFLNSTTGLTSASVQFTPNCSLAGTNTITIRVTDQNGESNDYSASVNVSNPNVASIDSYSPTANPVVILSTETKNFIIAASGNPPLTYQWSITPGSTISSCNNLSNCPLTGADFTPGSYVIKGKVTDSLASTDEQDFNVIINEKPRITFNSPSPATAIKMNCSVSKNFNLTIEDLNHSDGQSYTVTWYLNNSIHATLTRTNNLASHPMTSSATFSPNCNSSLIGEQKIKAVINDGYESTEVEWDVTVNYFSEACNNLSSGQVCTITGLLGMGSGLNVNTSSNEIRLRPEEILNNPNGGIFITDIVKHVVWFYNNTSSPITVLGKTIAANTIYALFGAGIQGTGTNGQSYNNFYLNQPKGIAYSSSENALYVGNYGGHSIVRFASNGEGVVFAGTGANNTGNNTDGDLRTAHRCANPNSLALDESENKLFVTCYGNTANNNMGIVKYFMTNVNEGYTLARYSDTANNEGSLGYNGAAKIRAAYTLTKDPYSKILYVSDLTVCQVMALSYGGTRSYHNGAVSLPLNELKFLTNTTSCDDWNGSQKLYSNTGAMRYHSLEPFTSGGSTKGLFYSDTNRHIVGFINFSSEAITLGNRTINPGYIHSIFGVSATANYSRNNPTSTSAYLNSPFGVKQVNNTLYIADRLNYKIASMNIGISNGTATDLIGTLKYMDHDGELAKNANSRQLYQPSFISYSSTRNSLYIMSNGQYRLKELNLNNGSVQTVIGSGLVGNSNSDPEDPLDAFFRVMGDLQESEDGDFLVYTDYITGNLATNQNAMARIFNQTDESEVLFTKIVPANKVHSIAGNYVLGRGVWDPSYNGADATSIKLRQPGGVAYPPNMNKLYIAEQASSCILSLDHTTGVINEFIGKCDTPGNISSNFTDTRLTNPTDLELDSDSTYRSFGNFFIVDRGRTTGSIIKYANLSPSTVTIFGIDIAANTVGTLQTSEGYVGSIASFGNQICYSQGAAAAGNVSAHNVICVNRDSGVATLRIGKASASTVKGQSPHLNEQEGLASTSVTLSQPYGLAFDDNGNLYISEYFADVIRMVKRWF
jgi:hypothetical protein